jgi:O-antigen ligase
MGNVRVPMPTGHQVYSYAPSPNRSTLTEVLSLKTSQVYVLLILWSALVVVNFATGRTFRFYLSCTFWILANVLFLASGKGMFQVFVFFVLPSVLIGITDIFDLAGITMEMNFVIPMVNLIPYCMSGALKRYYPLRNQSSRKYPLIPFWMLFVFACILSAFLGKDVRYPTQSLRAVAVYFIIPFFFYLYASHALCRMANVRQVMTVIVLVTAFYSSILGIIQMMWRGDFALIMRNILISPESQQKNIWLWTFGEGKILSVWGDSASFGHVLCFALPLTLGLFLTAKNLKMKMLFFVALGLNSAGVLITGNRTDVLGAAITIFLVILAFAGRSGTVRGTLIKYGLVGMVLLAVIMGARESNGIRRLFMPQEWDKKTASSRTILINEGLRMFKSSPVFGIGLDNFRFNQDYRRDGFYVVGNYPHNLFIQILAETGIVGFLAFLAMLGAVFRLTKVTWKHRTETELDFYCMLFLISCVVLLFQGLLENSLFYPQTSCLWWTGIGIMRGRAIELKQSSQISG